MAKIIENKIVITLSRIAANGVDELDPVLDKEQLETLQAAVEGLVENDSVVVEVEAE